MKVAVLDDYQSVAREMADWGRLPADTELTIFPDHLKDEADVAARLKDYDIVVAMRERTPFPRSLLEPATQPQAAGDDRACATPRLTSPPRMSRASRSAAPRAWAPAPRSSPGA